MITGFGAKPPLNRRFDEETARAHVQKRYHSMRGQISSQVATLQQNSIFRKMCQKYYDEGYPDWVILSGILNIVVNRKAEDLSIDMETLEEDEVANLLRLIPGTVYPMDDFPKSEMDFHISTHFATALQAYGFSLRQTDLRSGELEKFLRNRMRHFDFDFPHQPLFGDPPGDWPDL
jgi:hypothetical protein